MNKNEMIRTVKDMIAAPSCCQELKDAGQKWLDAAGTAGENAAWDALCREAREDICTIDDALAFFESEAGPRILGAEKCKALAAHAREIKSQGAKWCDYPACAACVKILNLD